MKRDDEDALSKAITDLASEYGAIAFAFMSGKDPGEADRNEATKALIVSTQELCDHAAGGGIPVVLETFDQKLDKRCLIGPHTDAVKVSAEVRKVDPSFGLMLDLSHLPLQARHRRRRSRSPKTNWHTSTSAIVSRKRDTLRTAISIPGLASRGEKMMFPRSSSSCGNSSTSAISGRGNDPSWPLR